MSSAGHERRTGLGEEILLTVKEAANRTRIGQTLFYELLNRGEIASIKVNRRRLIPVQALAEFLERKLTEAAS